MWHSMSEDLVHHETDSSALYCSFMAYNYIIRPLEGPAYLVLHGPVLGVHGD
jgi:hypothetical protein